MKNTNILYFLLIVFFISAMISCSKNEDKINTTSRVMHFRINKNGFLQISSDGSIWISDVSEKTKNNWSDVLEGVKNKFRPMNR